MSVHVNLYKLFKPVNWVIRLKNTIHGKSTKPNHQQIKC